MLTASEVGVTMQTIEERRIGTSDPAPGGSTQLYHHFTVDVEEYFQVSALEPHVPRSSWESIESRIDVGMDRLLGLLERHDARGTFFVLGWVAERRPDLVRRIVDSGHELASHGWDHARVTTIGPEDFRESVRRSKAVLEQVGGVEVNGFRAPSFSIVPGLEWALNVLVEEGYTYDSSLFPISRRGYGYPGAGRDPYWIDCPAGTLIEVPPATLRRFGLNLPAAGGGYLRLLPLGLTRAAVVAAERRNAPATLYIHPWELDPDQPRLDVPWPTAIRHYSRLEQTESRLNDLLGQFTFRPISYTIAQMTHP
jgi:polysaccharide deacetylase family protein (PEP-CTERM system associated)